MHFLVWPLPGVLEKVQTLVLNGQGLNSPVLPLN